MQALMGADYDPRVHCFDRDAVQRSRSARNAFVAVHDLSSLGNATFTLERIRRQARVAMPLRRMDPSAAAPPLGSPLARPQAGLLGTWPPPHTHHPIPPCRLPTL